MGAACQEVAATGDKPGNAHGSARGFKTWSNHPEKHQEQLTHRLVATNHGIQGVDWLKILHDEIIWIQQDPIKEITDQLQRRKESRKTTYELHIITHGSNGTIKLGDTLLTKEYLEHSGHLLQTWDVHSIYLWSCEAGRNTELIDALSALTGTDVYASRSEISREHPHLSSPTGEETDLEALISETTLNQWSGKLASTQVLDANYQQLVFDHTNYDTSFNNPRGSLTSGQVILFKDVITIGDQAIDALYTLQSQDTNIRIDRIDDGGVDGDYISTDLFGPGLTFEDRSITAEISFYEAGTYTGSGTGNRVTLENIVINTYDIDAFQYQVFKGFQSYEVANNTGITISSQSDGSVKFSDESGQGTTGTQDEGRARVYYDAIDTFEIQMGTASLGYIYFYLDFQQGPAWTGDTTTTDTPAANFTWSTRNLTEAEANVGSFTETATITFNNPGTTIFAGSNGDTITHTATNVPAGLTTVVTRASDTTATLSVTGNATNHTTSDDLSNIELEFENSAFVVGTVGASSITDARITNFGLSFIEDTTPPKIAISSDVSTLKAGETAAITFTLTESSSNFVYTDIDVTGGTLSDFAGSGTDYTATFTPDTDSTTDGVIHVDSDKFSDSSSNNNQDGAESNNRVTLTVDTVRPKIAISSDVSTLKEGETAAITFTLTESSSNFVYTDIDVTGGTLSDFAGSGTDYTATFTPDTDGTTDGVIHVDSDKFSDSADNYNQDEDDENNTVTFTVDTTTTSTPTPSPSPSPTPDTTRPTIAITDDDADNSLSTGDTSTLTFTLSEASSNFIQSDVSVTGGSLSNWKAVSSTVYTATFTPTTNSTSDAVIHVANDKFSDASSNYNKDEKDANNTCTFTINSTTQDVEKNCLTGNLISNSNFIITNKKDLKRIKKRGWGYSRKIPSWTLENGAEIWRQGFKKIIPPAGAGNYFIELDAKRPSKKIHTPTPSSKRLKQRQARLINLASISESAEITKQKPSN